MSLRGYIARRIVYTLVLVLFVIVLNWIIFQLMPGVTGAISSLVGNSRATQSQYDFYIRQYGLDQPPLQRFITYFYDMLTFNFGVSFQTQHPVIQDVVQSGRLVNTLTLLGISTVLAIVIGVLLGVVVSHRRGGVVDNFWVSASLTTFSLPTFWIGITFIAIFAIALGWIPPGNV